jgi:hypothetical protein
MKSVVADSETTFHIQSVGIFTTCPHIDIFLFILTNHYIHPLTAPVHCTACAYGGYATGTEVKSDAAEQASVALHLREGS